MATKSLKTILNELDHADDTHWTADGRPRVAAVNELGGEGSAYTADEIADAWGDRKREIPDSEAKPRGDAENETEKTVTEGVEVGKHDELVTEESGVIDLDENPDAPKIRAQTEPGTSDRVAKLGDDIVLFTPNPIDGQVRNMATITRLNSDGTVNAAVKTATGTVREFSSVKAIKPQPGDISAYFQWPEGAN